MSRRAAVTAVARAQAPGFRVDRWGIRNAVLADLVRMGQVYRESSLSNQGDRAALLAHPEVLELSDAAIRDGRTRVAVDASGRVVGFVTTALEGQVVELEDIFVDPEHMRRGVGGALIADAVAFARQSGASTIRVIANRHAEAFYEALGFVQDGPTQTLFGPGDVMHLDLD